MSKMMLNRLKKIEQALKPTPRGPVGAGVIPIWRQSDVDPALYRCEEGGPWVDAETMRASLNPTVKKSHPIVVIVCGKWSEVEQRN